MSNFSFPKKQHLRTPADFQRVYDIKQRAGDKHLLIFGAMNDLNLTRIGLSVSKKNGNAVRRNRIKRLLREAFRLTSHQLPETCDFILIPRPGSGSTLTDYQSSLKSLTQKIHRRMHRNDS